MPTWTDELGLWKGDPGETYSSGSHTHNMDLIDDGIGVYRLDGARNGVAGGCDLSITGAGQSVSIAAGTVWHNSQRYTPIQTAIGGADGLTTATTGDYRVFYDPGDTASPYYATALVANDARRDTLIGWVEISAGSVTQTRPVPRLGRDADFTHIYAGDAASQALQEYPTIFAPIRATMTAGSVAINLSRCYAGTNAYTVAITPETDGTGRLRAVYATGSSFTVVSNDAADARTVRCMVIGYEDW